MGSVLSIQAPPLAAGEAAASVERHADADPHAEPVQAAVSSFVMVKSSKAKVQKTKGLAPEREEVVSDDTARKRKRRRASAADQEVVMQSPSPPAKGRAKSTYEGVEDGRQAEDCRAAPSSGQKKSKSGGSRTPGRAAREHARSAPAQPWVYLGCTIPEAVLNRPGGPGHGYMQTPDGRHYPTQAVFSTGDKLLDVYKDVVPDDDQEFVIEAILDERRRGIEAAFRVKWRGYELNPEEWIPYELLADTVALEAWEARQRAIVEAWDVEGAVKRPCGRAEP